MAKPNMTARFPLFNDLIRNVELAMAKADLAIARHYASLVHDVGVRERVWKIVAEEFERTRRIGKHHWVVTKVVG